MAVRLIGPVLGSLALGAVLLLANPATSENVPVQTALREQGDAEVLAHAVEDRGPRQGGVRAGERPRGEGPQEGGPPRFERLIEFLKSQGITRLDELTPERRTELREAFRKQMGMPGPEEHLRTLLEILVSQGITTPEQLRNLSPEQVEAVQFAVREKLEQKHKERRGDRPGGEQRGPRDGQGPREGMGDGRMLRHLADRMAEVGITNFARLTDEQIRSLLPPPPGEGPRGEGPRGPRMGGPQGEGQRGPREGGPRGEGMRGEGPRGEGRRGPRDGAPDPIGHLIDWLQQQGITHLDQLTPEKIAELAERWRTERRDPQRERPEGRVRNRNASRGAVQGNDAGSVSV